MMGKDGKDRMTMPYVATDLSMWMGSGVGSRPLEVKDVSIEGKIHRSIDPPYYAWLRSRMERASGAFEKGLIDRTAWNELRGRFNRMHDQAVRIFGQQSLIHACEGLDEKGYDAPGADGTVYIPTLPIALYVQAARHIDWMAPVGGFEWVRSHADGRSEILALERSIDFSLDRGKRADPGKNRTHRDPASSSGGGKEGSREVAEKGLAARQSEMDGDSIDRLSELLNQWIELYDRAFEQYTRETGKARPARKEGNEQAGLDQPDETLLPSAPSSSTPPTPVELAGSTHWEVTYRRQRHVLPPQLMRTIVSLCSETFPGAKVTGISRIGGRVRTSPSGPNYKPRKDFAHG